MSITLCINCCHYIKEDRSDLTRQAIWYKNICKAVLAPDTVNYITGEIEKPYGKYEYCNTLNKDGKCIFFNHKSKGG